MENQSYEWIKHLGQRCLTVSPQKRNITVLNRWWYITGNYPHFIGARVANFTFIFLNDQQEQNIIMSSLIHWSDLLFAITQACRHTHTFTHTNMDKLKYYSLFPQQFLIQPWQHCVTETCSFFKPIIAIHKFLVQSQLERWLKLLEEPFKIQIGVQIQINY